MAGFSWNREPTPEQDNVRVPVPSSIDLKTTEILEGVKHLPDLQAGPKKKNYIDFLSMRLAKLRGTNAYYWVLEDHNERNASDASPLAAPDFLTDEDFFIIEDDFKITGNVNMYGEPVEVGEAFEEVKREVKETWLLDRDPKIVRGIVSEPEEDDDAGEQGNATLRRFRYDLPRKMCEELGFRPYFNDVVRLTLKTKYGTDFDGYYQVEKVERVEARIGATGFFAFYKLMLVRSSRYPAERMQPREEPPIDVPDSRSRP